MSTNLGIKKTHQLMKDRLVDYITSQYFGDNQLLLNASDELLNKVGNLFQKPYIESTPSYLKVKNGILNSSINEDMKKFFIGLIDKKLGVFETPFKHQVDALEKFTQGRNLFVATGTGSGKTECFMWPMIYKLVNEAIHSSETWKKRGVRTIVIYPMNALVSDQISRLRRIIGDRNGDFIGLLNEFASNARRPQFGMYTGRTPYAGDRPVKKNNLDIAESYENSYLVREDLTEEQKAEQQKDIDGLIKINKYPSKNIKALVRSLRNNDLEHYDSTNDAELLLRYEMQQHTPDILITNYSMLEYMLIRTVESNIWKETKEWLNLSKDNKLLIIIDEAHMYSGASGGEVALLIRRLFSKLGISKNKVQFILTSASMPNETKEDMNYIRKFSSNLSGCEEDSFEYLFGEREIIKVENEVPFDIEKLANLELDSTILNGETIDKNIKLFAKKIFNEEINIDSQVWLYKNLARYAPFVALLEACRGKATSYDELQKLAVNEISERGNKAFENLLLLAPLAKDEGGNVIFPARIHLFFRGLNGIYACLNPKCNHKHEGDGISLGSLFVNNRAQCPYCHSKVYELVNDRRCGALYIKTFVNRNSIHDTKINCWNKKGIDENNELVEFPLFILPKDYCLEKRPDNTELAYFDFVSGKLYPNEINNDTCIKVLRISESDGENASFKVCPHCERKFSFIGLSDFRIKGNIPFYNLTKAQFDAQPMTKEPTKFVPNGGKKVLLFSDSRQSAAVLARDMTKIADMESFRKAIYLAMKKIYSSGNTKEFPLNFLYPAFVEVCIENKLRFFYGRELDKFEQDKQRLTRLLDREKIRGRKVDYSRLQSELNTPCQMYQADLIELFCSPTFSFHKLGLGYIAPIDEKVDDVLFDLNDSRITQAEFGKIFVAFVSQTCTDAFSFDNTVPENVRKEVKYIKGNRYGFNKYDRYINDKIKTKYPDLYEKLYKELVENFYRKEDENYFLNLQFVKVVLTDNENSEWYRCKKCGNILPFEIDNCCMICGSSHIEKKNINELKQIYYWRNPIISDENIKSLNTEEHTAQLSFKDQKIETWAKTEDYEMRFQDVNVEKITTTPIDILSCTTTMEVGIDIGSLTAIGLRNVPPLRENYQQRAGRAGRRGSSLSTISVYAQGGPHDTYYFNSPDKIIKGKPRKPWIDINSDKIIYRHFSLIMFTKYFENKKESLYTILTKDFKEICNDFYSFVNNISFSNGEIIELFLEHDINKFKKKLIEELKYFLSSNDDEKSLLFDDLFSTGILPTYSFPLDVIEFNIEGPDGKTKLAPQRGIDVAISEYAPGRTIVVDKKTYKSAGIYSPVRHKDQENFYRPAEPYFKEENGFVKYIYSCSNPICGWFGKEMPTDGMCPFCGQPLSEEEKKEMIIPWGFAPLNARDIPESEADSEMTYADDPCYSATPSNDLTSTKYKNLKVCNRKNEEILILNKGNNSEGFDICRHCGAAQPHSDKSLRENGIGAPFTNAGNRVSCNHKFVDEGVYLGTGFRTDMFFMQVEIDMSRVTDNPLVLKSAAITLCEAMKLATSRILDISYNDLTIGTRTRSNGSQKFIDIYFYDSLSSGAGYSTQIESFLDDIINDTLEILCNDDDRDICNFWNQRIQGMFNKKLAHDFLIYITKNQLPDDFSENETRNITLPLINILTNESKDSCFVSGNSLFIQGTSYLIIPAFKKSSLKTITDFEILEELPSLVERIKNA